MKQRSAVATLVAVAATMVTTGLLGVPPALAQPNPTVEIRIEELATGREISVKQRGVGVCKNPAKCGNAVTWLWKKGKEAPDETIVIEYSGGTPSSDLCLDQKRYVIDRPKSSGHSGEATGTVSASCPGKSAWFYDVKCLRSDGSSCGIPDVDPGVIIDG